MQLVDSVVRIPAAETRKYLTYACQQCGGEKAKLYCGWYVWEGTHFWSQPPYVRLGVWYLQKPY
jgi:hypothetical protein